MADQLVIETPTGWMINCVNCGWHEFPKPPHRWGTWQFNGDVFDPTFTPSMNECVNPKSSPHHNPEWPERRCHFIVANGQITYCGDCSHGYGGQTMPMIPFDAVRVKYYEALAEEAKQKGEWK